MSRNPMFDDEEVPGIRGLTALTEPGEHEHVGAIIDVAVIGARGDGKTQFIVHAIRTLRAAAPALSGAEHQYNRDVMQVVMNAREPRPDATAPGVVPHYVFRIRPDALFEQVGFAGRLGLLVRAAGLLGYGALAVVNAAALLAVLGWLGGGALDTGAIAATAGVLALGVLAGYALARRRFRRGGEIEIVFWDVAGEHVYSASAADYYAFLSTLVRERKRRAEASGGRRAYAFAPVLMCNPVSLGVHAEGSSYGRLRQLMPLFASIDGGARAGGAAARALVAINRWEVVQQVCAPDSDREEVVALVSRPLSDGDADADGDEASDGDAAAALVLATEAGVSSGRPPTSGTPDKPGLSLPLSGVVPLPLIRRDVVRRHCLDAEDARDLDVAFTYLRYDAGVRCEFHSRPWAELGRLPASARRRYRAPTSSAAAPAQILEYLYAEGPGSFDGEARQVFLRWIGALACRAPAQDDRAAALPEHESDDAAVADGPATGAAAASGLAASTASTVDGADAAWRPPVRHAEGTPSKVDSDVVLLTERAARNRGLADADPASTLKDGSQSPWQESTRPGVGSGPGARERDDDARQGGFGSGGT